MPKPMDAEAWLRFKEELKERAIRSTFKVRVEELEAICSRTPGVWPNRSPDAYPPEHSQAWFAEEILRSIADARSLLEQGHASAAASEALDIGILAAGAGQLNWPDIQRWRRLIDNESKELSLVGEVYRRVALAGQIPKIYDSRTYALDMEIEFKDDAHRPSGKSLYLQLKSGESHLRTRQGDGAQIFAIDNQHHVEYWRTRAFPVFLVIADSHGRIRWMELRAYLDQQTDHGKHAINNIVFQGETLDTASILKWRTRLLE